MSETLQRQTGGLTDFDVVRRTVGTVWQRFLTATKAEGITTEDFWLILQLTDGPVNVATLRMVLSLFVDEPGELLARAEERHLVLRQEATDDEATIALAPKAVSFLRQLILVAQAANQGWREELRRDGIDPREIDFVLGMLQGARPLPPA